MFNQAQSRSRKRGTIHGKPATSAVAERLDRIAHLVENVDVGNPATAVMLLQRLGHQITECAQDLRGG